MSDFPYNETSIRNMTNEELVRVVLNWGEAPVLATELAQRLEVTLGVATSIRNYVSE